MMRKPPEISDDEWDSLTSPENYYCDGEVSRTEADRLFKQKVSRLVAQRRAKPTPSKPKALATPQTGAERFPADTMVFNRANKGHNETESRRLLNELRQSHSGDNLVHALVYNGFATEKQATKFVAMLSSPKQDVPRKEWVGARRVRNTQQPTNAAAVSRVLKSELGNGYFVTQVASRRVMVQNGSGSPGLQRAAQVLAAKGYSYSTNGQSIVISGRYA